MKYVHCTLKNSGKKQMMEVPALCFTGWVVSQPREKEIKEASETLRIEEVDPMPPRAVPTLSDIQFFIPASTERSVLGSSDQWRAVGKIRCKSLYKYY